ncbi:RNA 2'-phosphotransferase [Desulfobotulus sp. H1]|uniref:RNA 2'-phosphotransferase n=1 Tax=Desulfobotulus pelophilus TaxID=2823377 RepID=A0ABT3NCM1_9BACT|nr:RNA 2'-phosphotransferase [Desulfobotulus pelophilus]MCW7755210.1 RNA 2'-phosphotransferase [Desulfobotulus pelophilus]
MQRDKKLKTLAKTIETLLGRHPDAHGLLPDAHGWVKITSLLQVFSEDPELPSIHEADLMDISRSITAAPIQVEDKKIRATARSFDPSLQPVTKLPKLLHLYIRSKAWSHVSQKGLCSSTNAPILFTQDKELALRMGKRKDSNPIHIEIHVFRALASGVIFYAAGTHLFVADAIPAEAISGPPVSPQTKQPGKKITTPAVHALSAPASILLHSEGENKSPGQSKNMKESWKHNKKRLRKQRPPFLF